MAESAIRRLAKYCPNGTPRYVHVYDNGEGWDRYTVVYTGRYRHKTGGSFWYLGRSGHGESDKQLDYPSHKHLGKKIPFSALPDDLRGAALRNL